MKSMKVLDIKEEWKQGDETTYHCEDRKGNPYDVFIQGHKLHIIRLA